MPPETHKLLVDILHASDEIREFTEGYDSVDETIIWDVISIHLDAFITQVETLASE